MIDSVLIEKQIIENNLEKNKVENTTKIILANSVRIKLRKKLS